MFFSRLAPIFFIGVLATCGESKKDDDLRQAEQNRAGASQSDTEKNGNFEIKAGTTSADASGKGCELDLAQVAEVIPADNTIKAIFSVKGIDTACTENGKKPILYIKSDSSFKSDPSYGCRVMEKPDSTKGYNIRCAGDAMKLSEDRSFKLDITGDGKFDSSRIQMGLRFE